MRLSLVQKILALPFTLRQQRLAKYRPPMGESEFVKQIGVKGGDEEAAILIRNYLLDWIYTDGFTPYPDDNLGHIYGIAEEELDEDLILMIFRRVGVEPSRFEAIGQHWIDATPLQVALLIKQARVAT